jgi:hypothetical protein
MRLPFLFPLLALAAVAQADPPTPTRLTFDDGNSLIETDGGRNAVVSESGNLFIVWSDDRDGNSEVYLKERLGGSWTSDIRLTNDPASSTHPAIGRTDSGELRIVWEDNRTGHPEIWIKRKVPQGSWGIDQCVTCDGFNSERPAMSYSGSGFAWEETKDGNYEIYSRTWFSDSPDPEFRISNNGAESRLPSISGRWYPIVAWQDLRDGNWEIYSRQLPLGSETRVSSFSGSSTHPSVWEAEVMCSDVVIEKNFLAWQDDFTGIERVFGTEGQFGSWNSPGAPVSQMPGPSIHPSFTIELEPLYDEFLQGYVWCDRPVFAWEEHSLNALPKIFLRKDFVGSGTEEIPIGAWPSDPVVVTWRAGLDRFLEIIWTDQIDGNPEIYHASIAETFQVTDVPLPISPAGVQLSHPRPNPFQENTQFSVRMAKTGTLTVGIYDTAGRLVHQLHNGWIAAGVHEFTWRQAGIAAGTYHVRVEAAGGSATQKVQLIR